ncbi:MAG TPA: TetR/AcrR family transcriptional regulator [Actinobacteria bacterium]|nr:transcriptional regulator BetI [bacterium BMS3Bbin02]HDL41592.1 TetR/AcrR family transcriptional regulator [Actinomycetota bacterium]
MPKIRAENIERHKVLTRNMLLDAAELVLSRQEYAGASLSLIADTAGIPRTTVYEYFGNKDELLVAVLEDRVPPIVDEVVAGLSDRDPAARIELIFDRLLTAFAERPSAGRVVFWVRRRLPTWGIERVDLVLAPIRDQLADALTDGIDQGVFADRELDSSVTMVFDLLMGGAEIVLASGGNADIVRSEVGLRSSLVVRGLSAR